MVYELCLPKLNFLFALGNKKITELLDDFMNSCRAFICSKFVLPGYPAICCEHLFSVFLLYQRTEFLHKLRFTDILNFPSCRNM